MASLNKLSIRGIRSFSPDDVEQVISFGYPLTIIVGDNGCGKTTIIESLKYAVTGSLPPGNKSGQAFVNDPRSCGRSNVKASIKLRFANRAGKTMVCIRSVEVTQTKKTMSFKALDGIIRTTDENGQRVSLSHRCSELDRQVPALLGVSRPVLEHVVFCHQEDSSWPLMEGAVLKKRFDDIFDSTKYAQALEEIRKNRKRYFDRSKDLKADLSGLASHRHAAENYRAELEGVATKFERLKEQIADCRDKMAAEDDELERHREVFERADALDEDRTRKENEIEVERKSARNLERLLGKDLLRQRDTSDKELEEMVRNFDATVAKDHDALEAARAQHAGLINVVRKKGKENEGLRHALIRLKGEEERQTGVREERDGAVQELAEERGIHLEKGDEGDDGPLTAGDSERDGGEGALAASAVDGFLDKARSNIMEMQGKREERRSERQKEDDVFQMEIVELKAKLSNVENEKTRLAEEQTAARREIRAIGTALSSSRVRKSDVDESRRVAAEAARLRDEIAADARRSEIPGAIKTHEAKIANLQRTLDELSEAREELRKSADETQAVDVLERQTKQDAAKLEEDVQEAALDFQGVGVTVRSAELEPLEELCRTFQRKVDDSQKATENATEDQREKQRDVTETRAVLEHSQRSAEGIRRRLQQIDAKGHLRKIASVVKEVMAFERRDDRDGMTILTEDVHVQDLTAHLTRKIQDCSEEYDEPASIARVIKKLLKMYKVPGEATAAACPCCTRSMNHDQYRVFKDKMKQLADVENSELIQLSRLQAKESQEAQSRYERWRSLVAQGTNDWLDHARLSQELSKLEADVNSSADKLEELERTLQIAAESLLVIREEMQELEQFGRLAQTLRDEAARVHDRRQQVAAKRDQRRLLAPSSGGRDLRAVEQDMTKASEDKEEAMGAIYRLNREFSQWNTKLSEVTSRATKAERLASEREAQYKKDQENSSRKTVLNEKIKKCIDEEKNLMEQVVPQQQKILTKENERERLQSTWRNEDTRAAAELEKFRSGLRRIESLTRTIVEYTRKGNRAKMDALEADLAANENDVARTEADAAAMEPRLDALKQKLGQRTAHKKNLEDNRVYRRSLRHVEALEKDLRELDGRVEELGDLDSLKEVYEEISKKRQKYSDEMVRSEGRISGLKEQKRDLKRRLNTEEYHDIDERHRVKMIECETTLICISDLDKFYKSVDESLLQYHGMKIEDINKIIKELWTLTYRGEDINCIELVSGQETGGRATRSYNYRVVMTKGNTKIDMRGRCSAGQRVLASIVIRLALAETFCINCGVMALDEPTTNLDHENKVGLAQSLSQIIANRSVQRNFQLVVITHDEDFVLMMKEELQALAGVSMPEQYFQLFREQADDGNFYSKIRPVAWEDL